MIADDPLARQSDVSAAANAAVREARSGDRAQGPAKRSEAGTLTGAAVRKGKPPYRGRRRKGP